MKKIVLSLLLGLSLLSTGTTVTNVNAATSTRAESQTILIAADKNGNNKKYRVYKLKANKMQATAKHVETHDSKRLKNWHAQAVKINGKTWWKIGKNQYFKATRVHTVNVAFMKAHGQNITDYAN